MSMQKLTLHRLASLPKIDHWGQASLILLAVLFIGSQTVWGQTGANQEASANEDSGLTEIDAKASIQEKSTTVNVVAKGEKSGKVTGIKNVCVHVMKLEKTLKLYREILGFKMANASVLRGPGIEGMLVMELQAGDCKVHLSLPAPENKLEPIGNTNHNHFMLVVDNIVPICDKLKQEGYELENDNYARDKYSFFTGPNGEIVGLTEYK